MDKNTAIGFLLIALILIGFSWFNRPTPEQIAQRQRYNDSIAALNQVAQSAQEREVLISEADSTAEVNAFGQFSPFSTGEETLTTIENDYLKLSFSNKGGFISYAELKQYKTYDQQPLVLFDGEEDMKLNYVLRTNDARIINTSELYFVPSVKQLQDAQEVTMTLDWGEGKTMSFVYTIPNNDYMISYKVIAHNLGEAILPGNQDALEMQWSGLIRQHEKGKSFENRYSGINYKLVDDVEKLNENKSDDEIVKTQVKWIAYKDQFFSTVLIADEMFSAVSLSHIINEDKNSDILKDCHSEMLVSFDPNGGQATNFRIYLGPNKFKILNDYDKNVESDDEKLLIQRLVPLGSSIFRWVNRWLVIPLFNFFGKFFSNYGLIIFLMTLVIKLILFPLTYKSYLSSAKMRVLRPQIEEINKRIPAEKALERQQATMDLYKRAGASPMGGCLPMLLQFPILIAMFNFFPSSIELRQESFLWADDLSSYDAIVSWTTHIPLISNTFGNHISLFCLLMTIVNVIYTKVNMDAQGSTQQMPGMKLTMYLMPFMFLFMFNNYAAALSYYYLVSMLVTIIQTYLFRLAVDDEKLLKQLNENKKKPAKKSKFMERLEKMQKEQLELQRQAAKAKKK